MILETAHRTPIFIVVPLAFFLLATRVNAADLAPATNAPASATAPTAPASAPDAAKINGAEVIETKGQMTGLNFKDASTLTEADYKQIRQLEGLKALAFAKGPDDASLKILAGMPNIETFTSNGPGHRRQLPAFEEPPLLARGRDFRRG